MKSVRSLSRTIDDLLEREKKKLSEHIESQFVTSQLRETTKAPESEVYMSGESNELKKS